MSGITFYGGLLWQARRHASREVAVPDALPHRPSQWPQGGHTGQWLKSLYCRAHKLEEMVNVINQDKHQCRGPPAKNVSITCVLPS